MRDFKRMVAMGAVDPKEKTIIRTIQDYMSDGYWENSPRVVARWSNQGRLNDKGEIPINENPWYDKTLYRYDRKIGRNEEIPITARNPYAEKTDDDIRKYYADRIKRTMKEEMKYWPHDGGKFSKGDPTISRLLSGGEGEEVTFGDAYALYRKLMKYMKE